MKTVVDVINALRAINASNSNVCFYAFPDREGLSFTDTEFNQCVAEMTEGLFVPLSDLNKRKASGEAEVLTDKDGNQYQKGKRYLFSDDGVNWAARVLKAIVPEYKGQFFTTTNSVNLMHCKVDDSEAGTITKAPLVLEDGDVCKYDVINGSGVTVETNNLGYYDKSANAMHFGEIERSVVWCTNIIKLAPEVK